MLLDFPDNQLFADAGAPQISNTGFEKYIERISRQP
jgi:hypothetical protein